MDRYSRIESVSFDAANLPLPLSVKLARGSDPNVAASDSDAYPTSVELSPPSITAEVRIRGTAAAEALLLGSRGDLVFTVGPAGTGASDRSITVTGAVLVSVEMSYEQSSMATAMLRFVAEADDGSQNPYSAEDAQ